MPIEQKQRVVKFFALMKAIYGAARYQSQWDSQEAEKASMQVWAPKIAAFTDNELSDKLHYAQSMSYLPEYKFPDVGMILRGEQQVGAAGQAALSYRPASEVLGLPKKATVEAKSKGQAFLDHLREDIDKHADKRRKSLTAAEDEAQADIQRLVEKHVPFGKYHGPHTDVDGNTFWRAGQKDHHFESIHEGPHCLWQWQGPINGPKAATK
jgi:hypothetical protein